MSEGPLKTIMLIEGDHDTRVVLRTTLEKTAISSFPRQMGAAAWILRRIKAPCLILLDSVMA